MYHAEITGWGKCVPPAVLSNEDLTTFMDTTDEWITISYRDQGTQDLPL